MATPNTKRKCKLYLIILYLLSRHTIPTNEQTHQKKLQPKRSNYREPQILQNGYGIFYTVFYFRNAQYKLRGLYGTVYTAQHREILRTNL